MITNEVYVEIELLRKHGMSLRKIAEAVGCAVNTVRSHLAADSLPRYTRNKVRVSKLSPFHTYLRERQAAAHPAWIPATVLLREIVARGYTGRHSQLRAYMRGLKPTLPADPVVRFETAPGEQMQVDWVEFRKGKNPLYAFCATLGFSRASFVEFVTDMKVETLIRCHQHTFETFGGIPQRVLYDNMKTVVIERDVAGDGAHRFHAGFLDNERVHGASHVRPVLRLPEECLHPLPSPWRGDIGAARPQRDVTAAPTERPVVVIEWMAQAIPAQHPLAVYEQLLDQHRETPEVAA